MKRENFIPVFTGLCIQRTEKWLAEDDTEVGHIKNIIMNLTAHVSEIEKVIKAKNVD